MNVILNYVCAICNVTFTSSHLTFATCGTASCSKTLCIFALTLVFSLNMNWMEEDVRIQHKIFTICLICPSYNKFNLK